MSSKLKFVLFISIFTFLSLQYSAVIRRSVFDVTNSVISGYLVMTNYIKDTIDGHFEQEKTIQTLKAQNEKLEQSSLLLVAFAGRLNRILSLHDKEEFDPKLQLVRALSYEQISNYNRIWLDMKDFNSSKIYGLIYKGSTAGIVVAKDERPLGLLQGDNKCVFSVAVGENRLPGVTMGKGEYLHVKYIPMWMEPKVGDKVVTSGLDNIFVEGIPVGEVVEVVEEESYKSAIVKPNVSSNTPAFFYVIK